MDDLKAKFERAANHVQLLHGSLSQEQLLTLYGLYKQAIVGQNNTEKPRAIRFTDRRKWEAWAELGDMSKEEAMEEYIELVQGYDPDFCACVELDRVRVSSLANQDVALEDSEKTLFDWVKENDGEKLRSAILAGADLKCVDESGMSLLHWASDRGHPVIAGMLLRAGVDPGAVDSEGQTALHYAASCGHETVVRSLLAAGADPSVVDEDGCSPIDVALPPIKDILLSRSEP